VKKIKKITYQSKYDDLISSFGFDDGTEKYYKFIRGISLEKYILKYGDEIGNIKYEEYLVKNKNKSVTLEKLILKYGQDIGTNKYDCWKQNTRKDLPAFIKRYGEILGKEKYDNFKIKSLLALSKCDRNLISNPRKIEYWLKLYDNNYEFSKRKLSEYQNTSSLDKFVMKYGEILGKEKYIECNRKKENSLNNYIFKYGEVDGLEKYINYIEKLKKSRSKEFIIDKYGKEYYENLIALKTKRINRYSIIGLEFCEEINEIIKNDYKKIYYGDNEYMFYVFEDGIKIISPDFYIKDINVVIEFYGDFWHRNPIIYENKEDFFKEEIWKFDEKRLNILKTKFGCNTIVIWENDYMKNKEDVIQKIIQKINDINGKN